LELAQNGIAVIAVCRPGSHRASAVPQHPLIRRVECDVTQLEHLPELIGEKVDCFYHFAWAHTIGPGRNDMPAQIDNIRYCIDAVHAAKALGCSVFVGAGSQAEYGRVEGVLKTDTPCNPENGYGIAKLCAGQMSRIECEKLGVDHIWARILSVYGPGDGPNTMISGVIRQLLAGEKPALTAGIQQWDYLYSGDAAKAFRLMGQHGVNGRTYVLGSGTAQPLRSYVEQLRDAIDPSLRLGFGEVPYGPLQVMHLQADISALHADTGFSPETAFETGIRNTINSYKVV
jgi:nucleoside-diphosphate-sugar epimerase